MSVAISIENLSKQYRVAAGPRGHYRTLRESLSRAAATPWRGMRRLVRGERNADARGGSTIWALDGVSLDVRPGEVVGVIGRNGAGKSTLLKIVSRVTEPTRGRVTLRGRLASLLEVGTGFHHELTGRENIYLSGAILGLSKRELARLFDRIVDFAEIGGYLDTPVKRYSSGMLVRLAFAVAAHLDPDILLLDEVLAVGDAGFRAKCIRHMKETLSSNVAVLFVSHQRSQIAEVCDRCVVLHQGRVVYSGDPESAWQRYVESLEHLTAAQPAELHDSDVDIGDLEIYGAQGAATNAVPAHERITLSISYELRRHFRRLGIGVNFFQGNGQHMTDCTTFDNRFSPPSAIGHHRVRLDFDGLPFAGGAYVAVLRLYDADSGMILSRRTHPLIVDGPASQYAFALRSRWQVGH